VALAAFFFTQTLQSLQLQSLSVGPQPSRLEGHGLSKDY